MTRIKSTDSFQNIFSERLKAAREKKGFTQENLSEIIGVSPRTYQKYESDELASDKNRSVPNFETVVTLCKKENLDCDLGYLAGDGDICDFKQSTKSSADYLEMEYDTIEKIRNYSPDIKQLLNKLVLHSNGDNLLKLLQAIRTYSLEAQHSNIRLEIPETDIFETQDIEDKLIGATPEVGNTLPDISKKMLRYTATTTFDEILLDTYADYTGEGNSLLQKRINKRADFEKKRWLRLNEEKEWRKLDTNELLILYCGTIGNHIPTEQEAFEKIDKEAEDKYKRYKKDIPLK